MSTTIRRYFLTALTLYCALLCTTISIADEPQPQNSTAITAMTPGYANSSVRLIRLTGGDNDRPIDIYGFDHAGKSFYFRLECDSGWLIYNLGFNAAEIQDRLVITPTSYGPEFIGVHDVPTASQSAYAYYLAQTAHNPLLTCGAGVDSDAATLYHYKDRGTAFFVEFPSFQRQVPTSKYAFQPQCLGLIHALGLNENDQESIGREVNVGQSRDILPLPCRRGVPVAPPSIQTDLAIHCENSTPYGATVRSILSKVGYSCASFAIAKTDTNPQPGIAEMLEKLTTLDLSGAGIADLRPLTALPGLLSLKLRRNHIQDLSPLAYLRQLKSLDLSENQIQDISFVQYLPQLTSLNLYRNQVTDITPVRSLTLLGELLLGYNQIRDISPLLSLNRLHYVDLHSNQISNCQTVNLLQQKQRGKWMELKGNPVRCP